MALNGGKNYLAERIWRLAPRHIHYVEPYFGGGAVLLARDPDDQRMWLAPHQGVSEVVNDIDCGLTNFWRVLADADLFADFHRRVEVVPFGEDFWKEAHAAESEDYDAIDVAVDQVGRAVSFFLNCRLSMAGRQKSFSPVTRTRTRSRMNNEVSAWLNVVAGLSEVHKRLRRVLILNRDALEVIRQQDGPGTFYYMDPPYPHGTRSAPGVYRHEMTDDDHRALLALLCRVKGKVMLSGYANAMYDEVLGGWRSEVHEIPNNAASGDSKRVMREKIWMNY